MVFTKQVGVFSLDFLNKCLLSDLSGLNTSDHKIYKCILIFRFPRTIRVCFRLGYTNRYPLSNLKRSCIFCHTIYNKNLPFCSFIFVLPPLFRLSATPFLYFLSANPLAQCAVARGCRTTSQRLYEGGGIAKARTRAKRCCSALPPERVAPSLVANCSLSAGIFCYNSLLSFIIDCLNYIPKPSFIFVNTSLLFFCKSVNVQVGY